MGRMQELMLAQWHELLRLRDEVRATSDPEAIHDLRVTSRRFRAMLGLFEPWLPEKNVAELKKSTRKLTRVLGGLRNIDEALIFFREHLSESETGGRIENLLEKKRPKELARIGRALAELDRRRLDRLVRESATRLAKKRIARTTPSLPDHFSATGVTLFRPISKLLPIVHSRKNHESRHALRIAIKKWRYFFEIAAPVLERDGSAILALLKEYQTILGHMNDVVEFGVLCGGLKLSRLERHTARMALRAEEELLMRKLAELIEQKPLSFVPL